MTQAKVVAHIEARPGTREARPVCHVCRQPIEEPLDSTCRACGRPVHISWAQGQPESACSRIVSPQGCCGIAFVCNPCAEGEEPAEQERVPL